MLHKEHHLPPTGQRHVHQRQPLRCCYLHRIPALLTEFGATDDLANLREVLHHADRHKMGWVQWAYTGNDKTSSSPNPPRRWFSTPAQPPTGANVNTAEAPRCSPRRIRRWSRARRSRARSGRHAFRLCYSTERPDRGGRFAPGAQTMVSVPAIEYPNGYQVSVKGGQVVSAPNAPLLAVAADAGADTVDVAVMP